MSKFIALYKAFSGGEWFGLSLRLIEPYVDGIVVTMSKNSWTENSSHNDCVGPLTEFKAKTNVPVHVVWGDYRSQEDQGRDGLKAVEEQFGKDSKVMIIDTDELWAAKDIQALKKVMYEDNASFFFRARITSYVKSVLYQTLDKGVFHATVGIANTQLPEVKERFQPWGSCKSLPVRDLSDITFHHMTYVRNDDIFFQKTKAKFANTDSQESVKFRQSWFTDTWANIPFGFNLHPNQGYSDFWLRIKGITPGCLPKEILSDPFVQESIKFANRHWRDWIYNAPPTGTIIPQPLPDELEMYRKDLSRWCADVDGWVSEMKTTYMESLFLAEIANAYANKPGGKILEIGCGTGGSSTALSLGAPLASLTCIDPFIPYDEVGQTLVRGWVEGDKSKFIATSEKFGFKDRVTIIEKNSDEAAEELEDGAYDVVFVDGNHTYDIVRADIELYWPKVKPGGILLGHDTTTRFPGVLRALLEWKNFLKSSIAYGTSIFFCVKE